MTILKTALFCAAALAFSASALAQTGTNTAIPQADPTLANDGRLIRTATVNDVVAAVQAEGDSVVEVSEDADGYFVQAENSDGFRYGILGNACDGEANPVTCSGLYMAATWGKNDTNGDLETVNQLNYDTWAISVFSSESSVGVGHYVILDGGITMENLKFNIGVFKLIGQDIGNENF